MSDVVYEHLAFFQSLTEEEKAYLRQKWERDEFPSELKEMILSLLSIGLKEEHAPQPTTQRTRGPRRPTPALVAQERETGLVRADLFQQNIVHALRSRNEYEQYPDQGIAERNKMIGRKHDGYLISTIFPFDNEGESSIYKALEALGDGCIDTYIACQMLAYEKNGTDNLTRPFLASPDDILAVCDKDKSSRVYTVESRVERINHLKALAQINIKGEMPGPKRRGKPTILKAEGRLLLVAGKTGEYVIKTGETVWEQYSIGLGPFFTVVPELNQQTAMMFRKLLSYSGKNERYQKRLGYYLTFMFKNNAKRGCTFICSMEKLLAGAGIEPERQVGRFKDAIEKALADLLRDGIIGEYACIVDASPEVEQLIEQHATGWWDAYAQMKWKFEAPEVVKGQYRKLLRESSLP